MYQDRLLTQIIIAVGSRDILREVAIAESGWHAGSLKLNLKINFFKHPTAVKRVPGDKRSIKVRAFNEWGGKTWVDKSTQKNRAMQLVWNKKIANELNELDPFKE